ncbi:hypothetical protein BAUCODRAFT_136211 [Baudoinia panamericana UAMH 10762]|uniref:Uncharacterized protein n=1 Tax=Baudoinia panamericana (strain UAMH 10762) TaxID=717646 RepID=M2N6D5_BAUPA|nr:uncharacterized protein BAUCODRAFT_136211 [Baudoinia panamericana UAMH 10762]EMC99628.1 hypothetical protein BAUCODRAFT_136211 [Baudoinia panamericana UAMH 10762]
MGIQGLLPLLKSIHKPTHLRNFAGQTLGVDAYGWLHRGTISCAIELAQQKPTRKHIDFVLNRVRMLIHFGVSPYLVFDGDYLPSKAHTEKERAARRKEAKRVGLELLRVGKPAQAYQELQKAIDVTPLMARELIEELKPLGVSYVVAPYEADSQLAYLEKQGIISGIVSEDSDLLVFGAKCLLTKLDQYGECVMIRRQDFTSCREVSLVGWTDREFRMMSMLSGCDYLPGIEGLGVKTAYRLVRKHKAIEPAVRMLQFDGKKKVPPGYLEAFSRAERTFLYQWVFCPEAQRLVNLNAPPAELDVAGMPYIGQCVEPEVAQAVAAGEVDPNTKERLHLPSRPHFPSSRSKVAETNEKPGVPITDFFKPTAQAKTVETPSEKPGKGITNFFKPTRTPLAELDPNSFTPSPSQQRLLAAQHTASWSASQASAARLPVVDRISGRSVPSSAPQPSRRTASAPLPAALRHSPKRQRLCSDNMFAAAMDGTVGLPSATSRFFSKHGMQPSPSSRKASRQRKHEEFELWSDDSAAEAVAAMTDSQEATEAVKTSSPKKRKKLAVYTDHDQGEPDQVATRHAVATQAELTVSSKGVNTAFSEYRTKWAFKADGSPSTPVHRACAAQQRPPTLIGSETIACAAPPLQTPSQYGEPDTNSPLPETLVAGSSPVTGPIPCHDEDEIPDEEWLAMEKRSAVPLPRAQCPGSEDLLVPNSPSSGSDDGRCRPKLDIGRFAFTA